jgi:hypothetical protein
MLYTVEIQAFGGLAGGAASETLSPDMPIWQAMHPAETVEADSADEAARDGALNQNMAEGTGWRVAAWVGENADTGHAPDAVYTPGS